jgi:NAD(P)H-flavin reductase
MAIQESEHIPAVSGSDCMTPQFWPIKRRVRETADVVTLDVQAPEPQRLLPGQFNMLYAFGIGEISISMSGQPGTTDRIVHTIRAVGAVSAALAKLKRGDSVGVRGPFGSPWPVEEAAGRDVLLVAGGIGLAPLRPALYHLLRNRDTYGDVALVYGARHPRDLLFQRELEKWRRTEGLQVRVTVDHAEQDWAGDVGVVTNGISKVRFDANNTVAMVCGPEIMIRFVALELQNRGLTLDRIAVSLERNMKCAVGMCGHCQFGPEFVCKDGPVFPLARVFDNMLRREI